MKHGLGRTPLPLAVHARVPLALAAVLLAPICLADRVQVSLDLDHRFIESLLREQVFSGPGESLRLNDDGSGCQYLKLSEPRVRARDGRLMLRVAGEARAGRALGGRCLLVLDWNGALEFDQTPAVGDDRRSIVLTTSSWRALRADGSTDTLSTTIGQWLERFLPPELEQTHIDFAEPLDQLGSFLALLAPSQPGGANPMRDTLAIDGVAAGDDRATVTLGVDRPPAVAPPPDGPEAALSAAELSRLAEQLDAVDAFFTYTISSLNRDAGAIDVNSLLEVLLELRRELVAILGDGGRGGDPARALFVRAWEGLAPVLRAAAARQADHADSLRYLTFIGAGDALRALTALGPAAGVEVSGDGLRRLARILIPADTGDPLRHDDAVDAELRRSVGFGAPLPPPQREPDTSWLDWLIPKALAAATLDPAAVRRLNNWVPGPGDMKIYLPMVRDVLRHVVTEQLRGSTLERAHHDLFRWLVFAAAWQESCWRQFTADDDMRVPVQSGSGDVGMMQINPRVWRGLYDQHGLRWDIVYNARAGADILDHYLINYSLRHREHETTGSIDNLARSAYAAYNGGPRQYARYRKGDGSAHGKKVDALFYEKYREVKGGAELAVTACYGG